MAAGTGASTGVQSDRESRFSTPDGRPEQADQPIPELLKQLADETTTLVRQELDLAKAEMTEKGKQAGKGAGMFGAAGLFGLGAFGAITACLIAALATFVGPTWVAALIVTVIYGAIAGVLALRGKKEIDHMGAPVPEQTIETIRTTPEAIKQ